MWLSIRAAHSIPYTSHESVCPSDRFSQSTYHCRGWLEIAFICLHLIYPHSSWFRTGRDEHTQIETYIKIALDTFPPMHIFPIFQTEKRIGERSGANQFPSEDRQRPGRTAHVSWWAREERGRDATCVVSKGRPCPKPIRSQPCAAPKAVAGSTSHATGTLS